MEVDSGKVLAALINFNEATEALIKKIRNLVATEGIEKLAASSPTENHYEIFGIYYDLFTSLQCNSMKGIIQLLGKFQRKYEDIQDATEEFFDLENQWDDLLEEIDEKLMVPQLKPDFDDKPLVFNDLEGNQLSLEEICAEGPKWTWMERLAESDCRVVIVGYGHLKSAIKWKEDVRDLFHSFNVYLDRSRTAYKRFGITRTVTRVCCRENLYSSVVKYMLAGRAQMSMYDGDDPIQNGADIIFNKLGVTAFTHDAKTASRPNVSEVLEFLNKQK